MRDLPRQIPVNEQPPQEQVLGEEQERKQPHSDWTVYSMDVCITTYL